MAAILRNAPDWPQAEHALYWIVLHRGIQYWIGPAQGPAAHVHYTQACQLAEALTPTPPPRRARRRSAAHA
jgi:hypothetical protein